MDGPGPTRELLEARDKDGDVVRCVKLCVSERGLSIFCHVIGFYTTSRRANLASLLSLNSIAVFPLWSQAVSVHLAPFDNEPRPPLRIH